MRRWLASEAPPRGRARRAASSASLAAGDEVEGERRAVAQEVGERVDAAALDAAGGDDELRRRRLRAGGGQAHRLDRRAEVPRHRRRPGDAEADVGGAERRERHPRAGEDRGPGAVGAEPRPGAAAEREHRRARRRAPAGLRAWRSAAAPSRQPSQRQRVRKRDARGLEPARSRRAAAARPSSRAGKTRPELPVKTATPRSAAQRARPPPGRRRRGSARASRRRRCRRRRRRRRGSSLGEVEAGLAGHQSLRPERRPRLGEDDGAAGGGQRLGGHQPGGAAADHQRVDALGRLHAAPDRRCRRRRQAPGGAAGSDLA